MCGPWGKVYGGVKSMLSYTHILMQSYLNIADEIRLVNGPSASQGRIEVSRAGLPWGGVCYENFDIKNANVTCKMAGYPLGAKTEVPSSTFGGNGDKFLLKNLRCDGTEESIFDCSHSTLGTSCSGSKTAGVVCNVGSGTQSGRFCYLASCIGL